MTENSDQQLQSFCEKIITKVAESIDKEPDEAKLTLRVPGGPEIGQQIRVDATDAQGLKNICVLSILNVNLSPASEVARIENERERQGKFSVQAVYSVQSIRRQAGRLVLLENFIAEGPATVREEDFRVISSEQYAKSVLQSVEDWARYRAWQLQELNAQ